MKYIILILITVFIAGCDDISQSDKTQKDQQEKILQEGNDRVGMPKIKNFREKKLLKEILEMRDADGIPTYVYIVAEQTGKLIFLGYGVGYGIPYSTEYTNPQKVTYTGDFGNANYAVVSQADPNGLFPAANAEGTWVLMKDPHGDKIRPVYIEPRCIISPFPLQ